MAERYRVTVKCGPSRTKQSFRDQVNINTIVARHRKTGMVSHLNGRQPFYGDVSDLRSYQEALNVVQSARDLFDGMSARVRSRFANDPRKMIEFLSDPENLDEAVTLGMVEKQPEEPKEGDTPPPGGSTPK